MAFHKTNYRKNNVMCQPPGPQRIREIIQVGARAGTRFIKLCYLCIVCTCRVIVVSSA